MNGTKNGASQGTMPDERDDGNTTTITDIIIKSGEKDAIMLHERTRILSFVKGGKRRLPVMLLNYIADKKLITQILHSKRNQKAITLDILFMVILFINTLALLKSMANQAEQEICNVSIIEALNIMRQLSIIINVVYFRKF